MARCPFAEWLPSPNFWDQPLPEKRQIVLHHTDGTMAPSVAWLRNGDRPDRTSAHFVVGRDARTVQLVDTDRPAWHAIEANMRSVGIEIEEYAGSGPMPDVQRAALIRLLRWLSETDGYPLVAVNNRTDRGVGYHSLWVSTDCPGDTIRSLIPGLVAEAAGTNEEDDDMTPEQAKQLQDIANEVANLKAWRTAKGPDQLYRYGTVTVDWTDLAKVQSMLDSSKVDAGQLAQQVAASVAPALSAAANGGKALNEDEIAAKVVQALGDALKKG